MKYRILFLLTLFFISFAVTGQTISGSVPFCESTTLTLTGTPAGGTWFSSNAAVAIVSPLGTVTGLAPGTATITYTESGTPVAVDVTINPRPATITGTPMVCVGTITTLASATLTGCTWSSNAPLTASVDGAGVVTGHITGTAIIKYTNTVTGCFAAQEVTVNAAVPAITGTINVCAGSTTPLYNAVTGGAWASSNISVAAVDAATGMVTGITAGSATITYTLATGCFAIQNITVNPSPAPVTSSSFTVCHGANITLSSATPGGTWSSSNPAVGTINPSGLFIGLAAGSTSIIYTTSLGCTRSAEVTVNPMPATIGGTSAVCVSSSITLTNSVPGGIWLSSSPSIATTAITGAVLGISPGVVNISYQLSTGCYATKSVTVNPIPDGIDGPSSACAGVPITLIAIPASGVWSTGSPAVLTVDAVTGVVTGLASGVGVITYSLSGTGCYATKTVTINITPAAITGTATLCPGATTTLSNVVPGGIWISGTTSVATVGGPVTTTTTVAGISSGTTMISYVVGSCIATRMVSVHAVPSAGVLSGAAIVCVASAITLTSTVPGGAWNSSAPGIGVVSTSGVVTGIAPGTTTITYTAASVCGSASVTKIVTVTTVPGAITGTTSFCSGTTSALADAVPGGTWSSSSAGVATVGVTTGIVTGVGAGTATIFYSIGSGCFATTIVTVNPAPGPITGAGIGTVCVGGVLALSDTAAGGLWTSGMPGIAMIATVGSTPGVLTGLAPGIAVMSYAIGSCIATISITVNPVPTITATATSASCGSAYTLTAGGGVSYSWSPASGLTCGTCAITGATPPGTTTYVVTGVDAAGCPNTATVTVASDRIYGHISFSAATPIVPDVKVWLIQYNPADSSVIASDSALTCMDGSSPYYKFEGKPAGSYLVKAKLLSSIPGTSDYIPTYGAATPNWFNAAAINHTGAAAMQNINMIYGTVPSGAGFISGYVYSGAGKGTAGEIPEAGMLMLVKNAATDEVLTYVYTNASGAYTFTGLPYASYIVYPEEQDYYTTASGIVTLTPSSVSAADVSFRKHTVLHTIYPYSTTGTATVATVASGISIYPNPATDAINIQWNATLTGNANITISDITGRAVLSTTVKMDNTSASQIDLRTFVAGIYIINVQADGISHTGKLVIE